MKRPDTIHPVTCAVRYYTKTGNTKKLALAIAQALGVEALPISEPVNWWESWSTSAPPPCSTPPGKR